MFNKKPRLLVVGMIDSPHLVNWLDAVSRLNRFSHIYVFPTTSPKIGGLIRNVNGRTTISVLGVFKNYLATAYIYSFLDKTFGTRWRSRLLQSAVKVIRPKVLHVQELQHGGYLLSDEVLSNQKMVLACSTWGSDLIFYGKLQTHKKRLEKLLKRTDFLLTEREADLKIAKELGFHGKSISPAYATVGSDVLEKHKTLPSLRTKIVIKGYQDNHGRALNALQALTLIPEILSEFAVVVISSSESVRVYAEFLRSTHNMNIVCAPKMSHSEIMDLFAESRVYIGLGISDGISNTMIESMQNGSFPIQSVNSCAPEFIHHGISGFIVDPWDIHKVATLIEISLRDDHLVDTAVELNLATLREKYSREKGVDILDSLYKGILNDR